MDEEEQMHNMARVLGNAFYWFDIFTRKYLYFFIMFSFIIIVPLALFGVYWIIAAAFNVPIGNGEATLLAAAHNALAVLLISFVLFIIYYLFNEARSIKKNLYHAYYSIFILLLYAMSVFGLFGTGKIYTMLENAFFIGIAKLVLAVSGLFIISFFFLSFHYYIKKKKVNNWAFALAVYVVMISALTIVGFNLLYQLVAGQNYLNTLEVSKILFGPIMIPHLIFLIQDEKE